MSKSGYGVRQAGGAPAETCRTSQTDHRPHRPTTGPADWTLPLGVPPVEVHEVPGLDAPGAGQPAAGRAAQGAPLHRHVQTLRVVHGLHHHTARGGVSRVRVMGPERRPPPGVRAGG